MGSDPRVISGAMYLRKGFTHGLKKYVKTFKGRREKKKGDNQKGGDQNRYRPFSTPRGEINSKSIVFEYSGKYNTGIFFFME
jgi:hypothetical protein